MTLATAPDVPTVDAGVRSATAKGVGSYLQQLQTKADRLFLGVVAVLAAISLGMAIALGAWAPFLMVSLPTLLVCGFQVLLRPGLSSTRVTVALAFMVITAAMIQQSHGLTEIHFGIFVLLALLLYYRDWLPIVVAAGAIAVHHVAFFVMQSRGMDIHVFAPGSGFGLVVLHATYVVAETIVLCVMCAQLRSEVVLAGASPQVLSQVAARVARGDQVVDYRGRFPRGSVAHAVVDVGAQINALLAEIGDASRRQAAGDFGAVLAEHDRAGTVLDLVQQINASSRQTAGTFEHVAQALSGLAAGRLDLELEFAAQGEFAALRDRLASTTAALARFRDAQARAVRLAAAGDLSTRLPEDGEAGFNLALAQGFNGLLSNVEQSLGDVDRMLASMAVGDLQVRVAEGRSGVFGDLARHANATADTLHTIVDQIREGTDAISAAASEIAAGNGDLSQRTEQQAASLEETASSMEELTATVRQTAENARQASELAGSAAQVASQGGAVVGRVVDTMTAINASSRRIVDITSVIDGIAFQTNILALNAAVEAARAGEQGRGFAVVASEVRSLAQRSASAAREIKQLIDDSVEQVDTGTRLVDEAGRTMAEIVSSVQRVTGIIDDISTATREQSTGLGQINQSVLQLDEGIQQNAALVEEASAAARSLEQQSAQLVQTVAAFRQEAGDSAIGHSPAPPSRRVERRSPERPWSNRGPGAPAAPRSSAPT